jgi:hypothetical protein
MNQVFSVSCGRLFMVVFVLLFFTGCAMKNATVAEEKRVLFSSKTEAPEVYRSGFLSVTYEYQRTGDKLTISGRVEYRQSVDSLDVRLVFLDATGLVLGKKIVYSSGFRSFARTDSTRTFRTNLEMPVGAVSFSFIDSSVARASQR